MPDVIDTVSPSDLEAIFGEFKSEDVWILRDPPTNWVHAGRCPQCDRVFSICFVSCRVACDWATSKFRNCSVLVQRSTIAERLADIPGENIRHPERAVCGILIVDKGEEILL